MPWLPKGSLSAGLPRVQEIVAALRHAGAPPGLAIASPLIVVRRNLGGRGSFCFAVLLWVWTSGA